MVFAFCFLARANQICFLEIIEANIKCKTLFIKRNSPRSPDFPSDVGPSQSKETLRFPPLVVTPSPSGHEPSGDNGGRASGSGESRGSGEAGWLEGERDKEESSPEPSRPVKRRNLGHRVEGGSYPIDSLTCTTTRDYLFKLKNLYHIPNDIPLVIPGKGDLSSRPPKGSVTLYLECFKLGVRLPLQPYFTKVLSDLHLAPGQLHPNRWRVLSRLCSYYGLGASSRRPLRKLKIYISSGTARKMQGCTTSCRALQR